VPGVDRGLGAEGVEIDFVVRRDPRRAGRWWSVLGVLAIGLSALLVGVSPGPAAGAPGGIFIDKTVGLDPSVCATDDSLSVGSGTAVTYCYEVTNDSGVTLTTHDLVDDQLGAILTDFPFALAPGASAFITFGAVIDVTTTNVATWTATDGEVTHAEVDTVTVTVVDPAVTVDKTAGTDESTCGTADSLSVPAGTEVFYCYEVTNTGELTVTRHDLVDDQLGTILTDFPFTLAPGSSAFITQSAVLTQTTTNVATWTVRDDLDNSASDDDSLTVTVQAPSITVEKTVGTDGTVCGVEESLTVPAGTEVFYCFEVTNTGGTTLPTHDLVDDQLGAILSDFPFTLAPGASAFITDSAVLASTTTNVATWTAFDAELGVSAEASDTVTVTVEGDETTTTAPPETTTTEAGGSTTTTGPGASTTTDPGSVGSGQAGQPLPPTGTDAWQPLGTALLLVAGGAVVISARRRTVAA
jgi:hypothetical protein